MASSSHWDTASPDDWALATACEAVIRPQRRRSWKRSCTQFLANYLSDDEYAALQQAIVANPEAGDLIRGSGGVRKLRWGFSGRGQRGGVRVIYYLRLRQE